MVGKVVVALISLILVAGAVYGIVAGVHKLNHKDDADNLSPQMKLVAAICQPTDYKEACQKSLGSVNSTDDPKEFIKAAILSTMDAVKQSFNLSDSLLVQANNDTRTKMALDDCKDLMDFAVDQLQASITTVGDSNMNTLNNRAYDIRNWLSSVIAYQESCLDGFEDDSPVKIPMHEGMLDARQLTRNALAIVSELSQILSVFGLKMNIPSTSRRLLSSDGYPTWFSNADRRLLAMHSNGIVRPNAVVAKDGSGQFKTISAALASVPKKSNVRYVIYVKAGIYNEYVTVDKTMTNVFMYGDGPRKTIVTGHKSYMDGVTTQDTASFNVLAFGFMAKNMGFSNTAGPERHQAVALRVSAEQASFFNCRMDGFQDTLYTQSLRQFYRNCVISGTVDFIFGDATVVIQNSLIIVRKPMENQQNTVTAHGRAYRYETTGLVIQNCRIVPETKLYPERFTIPTYLGRPWKEYSRTVIMESTLADFIQPAGWMPWAGNFALDTLEYREYANRGPGANTRSRINWKGYRVITNKREALQYSVGAFLKGSDWLPRTGGAYLLGLKY
ncbi:Pectinesterase domain-containing protein/PMEI domain-containing protein [Cephalotus follicularis]|uniref:Pectinesterase n=1 Tax=Cephalotus follicularis TaxID=3775 RepID=A0A1Q3CYD1_CEPFO|nr:Pectinesterase domain-containing protein/PMEI domain-containing protein [Cephalotus follicularis]